MTSVDPESFVWTILNQFEHISRERFHTLAFLCEHEYYTQHSEQITDTTYREYLSSVYNEKLDEVLNNQQRLEFEELSYRGEDLTRIAIPVTQVVSVPDEVEEIITEITHKYGDEENVETIAKSFIPREQSLLSDIQFDGLYEDIPSMADRLNKN